jgi:hypothetical protein
LETATSAAMSERVKSMTEWIKALIRLFFGVQWIFSIVEFRSFFY